MKNSDPIRPGDMVTNISNDTLILFRDEDRSHVTCGEMGLKETGLVVAVCTGPYVYARSVSIMVMCKEGIGWIHKHYLARVGDQ
jgi:hypothetical protein